jgi:hypothetical protein
LRARQKEFDYYYGRLVSNPFPRGKDNLPL